MEKSKNEAFSLQFNLDKFVAKDLSLIQQKSNSHLYLLRDLTRRTAADEISAKQER